MDAEGLRAQDDAFSRFGSYVALFQKLANARNDDACPGQQRVRFIPGNERSIIAIVAVNEHLFPHDHASSTRDARDSSASSRVDFGAWPEAFDDGDVAFGQCVLLFTRVIKCAVQLDVVEPDPVRLRDQFQGANLVQEKRLHLIRRKLDVTASEIATAPWSRMRAQPHTLLLRQTNARLHRCEIAPVPAASDVG